VDLHGWRLALAWGLLALLAVWSAVVLGRSVPILGHYLSDARPVLDDLHLFVWRSGDRFWLEPLAGGVAEAAGLPEGALMSIDGRPVAPDATVFEIAERLRRPVGSAVRLGVRDAQGDEVTVSIPTADGPAPPWREMGLSPRTYELVRAGLGLLRLLGALVIAYLVTRRRRSLVALLAVGFLTAMAGSSLAGLVEHLVQPFWAGAPVALPDLEQPMVLGFFLFFALFPDGRFRPRWAWGAVPLGLAVGWMVARDFSAAGWGLVVVPAFVFLMVVRVVRFRHHATPTERQQTKWVVLGFSGFLSLVVVFLGLMIYEASLPGALTERNLWLSLIGLAVARGGELLVPLGILVSLSRYRLWDVESAWSRSAAYAALTVVLAATVAGLTAVGQAALGADSGPLALGLATAAAALLFDPLQDRLRAWADERFLRDLQELRGGLPRLVDHLREIESVEGIAGVVLARMVPVVHASRAALVVEHDSESEVAAVDGVDAETVHRWMRGRTPEPPSPSARRLRKQPWRAVVEQSPHDPMFPVRVALRAERGVGGADLEGWLLLGPRPDGSGYGPDDLDAVADVAGAVGRALRVVRVREEREDALAGALDEIRREVLALRDGR
jgi:hypothetical protein